MANRASLFNPFVPARTVPLMNHSGTIDKNCGSANPCRPDRPRRILRSGAKYCALHLPMDLKRSIGLGAGTPLYPDKKLLQYINLKLASLGCPTVAGETDTEFQELAAALLLHHRETDRLLAD